MNDRLIKQPELLNMTVCGDVLSSISFLLSTAKVFGFGILSVKLESLAHQINYTMICECRQRERDTLRL